MAFFRIKSVIIFIDHILYFINFDLILSIYAYRLYGEVPEQSLP